MSLPYTPTPQSSSPLFTSPGTNISGLFLPRDQGHESQDLVIEKLEMCDLMRNPHYRDLFQQWTQATQQVIQNADYQRGLFQQINTLQAEVAELKAANTHYELQGFQ